MSLSPAFGLLQARVQAAHGRHLDAATWHTLAPARPFDIFLKRLRETSAIRWLQTLSTTASPHALENHLRQAWRRHVAEVAGWAPAPWRDAIRWCAWLVDLPLLRRVHEGEAPPGWANVAAPWDPRLIRAAQRRESLLTVWLDHWRALLPPMEARHRVMLDAVVERLRQHEAAMARAVDSDEAWALREHLEGWLILRLRQATGQPALPFIHLALTALELERLRGGLLQRLIWESPGA